MLVASPFVLLLTWARLRSTGYARTLAGTRPGNTISLSAKDAQASARDTSFALAVAIKYGPWRPKCLVRSLTLGWFLGRRGIPFEVRIGVPGGQSTIGANRNPDFSAHAWVEHDGVVLNDKQDIALDFAPFTKDDPG